MIRVLTVLGARPQFIKAATVSRAISARRDIEEIIVHTGQHFDANMSDVFFEQLDIPRPDYNLGIASLGHGAMTGRMLEGIEALIQEEKPDWVLVYGDTNSTLAGALAAAKLHVPVAHVEAGLRSHNPAMPEEVNRVLADRISTLLLCPTETAVANLAKENFPFPSPGRAKVTNIENRPAHARKPLIQRIENVGDVMFDTVLYYRELARGRVSLEQFGLEHKGYALSTLHRQENTDDPARLHSILAGLRQISRDLPVVLPLHPRTRTKLAQLDDSGALDGMMLLDPLPYLEMQRLQMSANVILTDSGGMQKEAFFHRVPCITLRDETEWVETVEAGWNQLVAADGEKMVAAFSAIGEVQVGFTGDFYGDGTAAEKTLDSLQAFEGY